MDVMDAEHRVRVVTYLGLGYLHGNQTWPLETMNAQVDLDGGGFLDKSNPVSFQSNEVFRFGNLALLRTVHLTIPLRSVAEISNLQFYGPNDAVQPAQHQLTPPDETHTFLDLDARTFSVCQALGAAVGDDGAVWVKTMVDCWGAERSIAFDGFSPAVYAFDAERNQNIGRTGGVHCQLLLTGYNPDNRTGLIHRLFIQLAVGPPGPHNNVVYERKFFED